MRLCAREGTARRARVPSVDSMDDPLPLDRHYPFLQPVFVSTAQIAATLTPPRSAALRRDHDHRNPWFTFGWNGRSQSPECALCDRTKERLTQDEVERIRPVRPELCYRTSKGAARRRRKRVDPTVASYALRGDGLIFTTFDGGLDLSRRNASATLSASCAKRYGFWRTRSPSAGENAAMSA